MDKISIIILNVNDSILCNPNVKYKKENQYIMLNLKKYS